MMFEKDKKRALRRRRNSLISKKNVKLKRHLHCSDIKEFEKWYQDLDGTTFYSKRTFNTCNCSKTQKGRPKVSKGICCYGGSRRWVVKYRDAERNFCRRACLDIYSEENLKALYSNR